VRLHQKGAKQNKLPCRNNLENYLDEYIAAASIVGDSEGPLFRAAAATPGTLTGNPMWNANAYRMIQRRAERPVSRPASAAIP
jgi:hypothetical protein